MIDSIELHYEVRVVNIFPWESTGQLSPLPHIRFPSYSFHSLPSLLATLLISRLPLAVLSQSCLGIDFPSECGNSAGWKLQQTNREDYNPTST